MFVKDSARRRTTFHVILCSVADPCLFPQAALVLSASSLSSLKAHILWAVPIPFGSSSSMERLSLCQRSLLACHP